MPIIVGMSQGELWDSRAHLRPGDGRRFQPIDGRTRVGMRVRRRRTKAGRERAVAGLLPPAAWARGGGGAQTVPADTSAIRWAPCAEDSTAECGFAQSTGSD